MVPSRLLRTSSNASAIVYRAQNIILWKISWTLEQSLRQID